MLGLAAIAIGWLVVPADDRASYIAAVLGGIGTTLLLVGIVLLLERRIVDTAVRVVRNANAEANEAIRAQVQDLEDRVAAEWSNATLENMAEKQAETARLAAEFTKRVVDEASSKKDETPS